MTCCARVYGLVFSLGVPLRAVYANALNSAATFQALARFAWARALGRPLKWLKTEHAYPNRAGLLAHKRKLGEILVGGGYIEAPVLAAALESRASSERLGEHLVNTGCLTVEALYDALSLQQGLPIANVEPETVPSEVAHALPERVVREWKLLPFRVSDGNLFLAGPEIPTLETARALRPFTALELRFHLVTPQVFATLAAELL